MTAKQWKEMVLEAARAMEVWSYLMGETEFPEWEVREAVNVLTESLPGMPESAVEAAMQEMAEYGDMPDMATFDSLLKRLEAVQTASEYELMCAQIIEQTMLLLAQVSLLDLSPSAHDD